jgi:hypothetical protein
MCNDLIDVYGLIKKTPAFRLVLLMTFAKVQNFGKGFSKLY